MRSPIWEYYEFTADDLECLEQFGEVMEFPPDVAARIITKLTKIIKTEPIDEPY